MALTDNESQDAQWTPAFVVRFSAGSSSSGSAQERAAEFWRGLGYFNDFQLTRDDAESIARNRYADDLGARIERAFAPFDAAKAKAVRLRVLQIRYGSFEMLVGCSDIKSFVDLLAAAGPALALSLLDTCAEESFESCFQARPASCEVRLTAAVEAGRHAAPTGGAAAAEAPSKTGWDGVVARALRVFWLVPTLLALAVLWVAFSGLLAQMGRAGAREDALAKSQQDQLTAYKDRITDLEKLNLELVKQLRAVPDKQDKGDKDACACCCTLRAPEQPCPPAPPRRPPARPICRS